MYKQKKEDEATNFNREEEEMIKLQKQQPLQLLKKKDKTENLNADPNNAKKWKQQKNKQQNADSNKPKKPASSCKEEADGSCPELIILHQLHSS